MMGLLPTNIPKTTDGKELSNSGNNFSQKNNNCNDSRNRLNPECKKLMNNTDNNTNFWKGFGLGGKKRRTKKTIKTTKKAGRNHRKTNKK